MTLLFKAKQTIEFIGDSITDCGRREPAFSPQGGGYVHLIHDLLQAGYPELKLNVINKGISGNTVLDLKSRWCEENPFRKKLCEYQSAIDALGEEFDLPVVHLQPAFDWAMLSKLSSYWTVDRVHPTREGHMLIALTILRTCGFGL